MAIERLIEGNPGALQFFVEANADFPDQVEGAFFRALNFGITGTKLYMLWNDCCGRDTEKALRALEIFDKKELLEHINYEGGRGIPFTAEDYCKYGQGFLMVQRLADMARREGFIVGGPDRFGNMTKYHLRYGNRVVHVGFIEGTPQNAVVREFLKAIEKCFMEPFVTLAETGCVKD